jgi:hypothetical protein
MSEPSVWLKLGEKQSMQMLSARMYLEQAAEVLVSRAGCAPDWGWGRTGGGGGICFIPLGIWQTCKATRRTSRRSNSSSISWTARASRLRPRPSPWRSKSTARWETNLARVVAEAPTTCRRTAAAVAWAAARIKPLAGRRLRHPGKTSGRWRHPHHWVRAMQKIANRFVWDSVGDRSRDRFATPADFPGHDCSPYRGIHARRERLGFVYRSRTLFYRPVPNLSSPIRNFCIAVCRSIVCACTPPLRGCDT